MFETNSKNSECEQTVIRHRGELDKNLLFFLRHLPGRIRKFDNSLRSRELDDKTLEVFVTSVLARVSSKLSHLRAALIPYVNEAKSHDSPALIFLLTDNDQALNLPPPALVFRSSIAKENCAPNEFLMPYLWECWQKSAPALDVKINEKPSLSFCGQAQTHPIRKRNIEFFQSRDEIRSDFILREKFWGGKPNDARLRAEFLQNMQKSAFALCDRGNGSFSMRFYQCLSLGRIPVLDTSTISLPFASNTLSANTLSASDEQNLDTDNNSQNQTNSLAKLWQKTYRQIHRELAQIDYENCAIIGETPEELLEKILRVIAAGEVVARQKRCRSIFEDFLSARGFAKQINRILHLLR